jgi:hypothetical protein
VLFTPKDTTNYTSATASVALKVLKAKLTVTADDKSRAYASVNPEFTGTVAGVQNNDKLVVSYSCSATVDSPVAVYPIVPTLADPDGRLDNYSVTLNNGMLTVVWTFANVTLGDLMHAYDGAPKAASATTIPSDLPVMITYDGTKNMPVAAGFYTVTATVNDETYTGTATGTFIIKPCIVPIRLPGSGEVQLQFVGKPATRFAVEVSAELTRWTPLITNQVDAGGIGYFRTPVIQGAGRSFYRLQIIP